MRALALVALLAPTVAFPATVWTLGPNHDGESLSFTDVKGPCVGPAHVVIWQKPDSHPIPGCYRIDDDGIVLVVFLDGDRVRPFHKDALKKATSL